MNGHFAAVGDAPSAQHYEHGVQVIDEDKQYKSVALPSSSPPRCLAPPATSPASITDLRATAPN